MIKYQTTIQITAPTLGVSNQKKVFLEQLATLDIGTLKILADKSKKNGISQKLRKFQHLI